MAQATLSSGGVCPLCKLQVKNLHQHLQLDHVDFSEDREDSSEAEESPVPAAQEIESPWEFYCDICQTWLKGHRMRHYRRPHLEIWPKRKNPTMRKKPPIPPTKPKKPGQRTKKRYYVKCPVKGCRDVVVKLRQHLRLAGKHKQMGKEDLEYYCSLPKVYKGDKPARKRKHSPSVDLPRKKKKKHLSKTRTFPSAEEDNGEYSVGAAQPTRQQIHSPSKESHTRKKFDKGSKTPLNISKSSSQGPQQENTPPSADDIFRCFALFLTMINRSVQQNVNQVKKVMDSCGYQTPFDLITKRLGMRQWYINARKTVNPSTLASYIHSLRVFGEFIRYEGLLPGEDTTAYMEDTKILLKGLTKLKAIQKAITEDMEDETCLEIEDLLEFKSSNQYKHCIAQLSTHCESPTRELTKRDFMDIQDILIACLVIDNAQRSGAIRNMTVGQFLAGKNACHEDDFGEIQHIIKVVNHKTTRKYGSALLAANGPLFRHMEMFYQNVRPKLEGFIRNEHNASSYPFFVQYSTRPYDTSGFSKRIAMAFRGRFQNRNPSSKHATSTKVRKLTVTRVMCYLLHNIYSKIDWVGTKVSMR